MFTGEGELHATSCASGLGEKGFRVAAFEGYGVYGLRVRGYDSVFRASGCQIWEFPKKTGYLILGPL